VIGLRRALWAVAGAGLLLLAVQIDLIATSDFAPDRGLWVALDVVIGGGFVAVGLFAWSRRPDSRVGALMVVTGFAWFLSVFNLTEPALLFSVGLVLSNFYIAPAIHLLLGFPSGRLGTRVDRWLVGITYAAVTIGFLPIALTFDPSTEGCNCPENVFLADSHPSFARTWFDVLDVIGVIVLLAVLGRLVSRWRRATPPMRRVVTPLFAAGAVLMAMLAVLLGADLLRIEVSKDAYYLALIPFGLVPYLFLGSLAQARMLRGGAVGELVAGIGATLAGRELRDALARALNDPSLELAFWLPESGVYVDPEGQPLQLPQSERRATSDVTLDGRRVAVLIHDPLLLEEPELIEAVGATAALALEKDRLEAELRAKIGELRELARGIHPAVLSDRGLDPAITAIADRAPLPVEVVGGLGERLAEPVELAAYFVVSEALTNVVKYAQADQATVRVERENGRVVVEVADDGVGGADPSRGTGLRGLADRISALGGRLEVDTRPEGGTMVRARIPCE
jgi:signal transduction histidine kinase